MYTKKPLHFHPSLFQQIQGALKKSSPTKLAPKSQPSSLVSFTAMLTHKLPK